MSTYRDARVKAEKAAMRGIIEASLLMLQDGGVEELLQGLAYLLHGEVLPAPVIAKLERKLDRVRQAAAKAG